MIGIRLSSTNWRAVARTMRSSSVSRESNSRKSTPRNLSAIRIADNTARPVAKPGRTLDSNKGGIRRSMILATSATDFTVCNRALPLLPLLPLAQFGDVRHMVSAVPGIESQAFCPGTSTPASGCVSVRSQSSAFMLRSNTTQRACKFSTSARLTSIGVTRLSARSAQAAS